MKKQYDYVVEFKRVSYVRLPVIASDDEDAEDQAWDKLDDMFKLDKADWSVESIEVFDEYTGEE